MAFVSEFMVILVRKRTFFVIPKSTTTAQRSIKQIKVT